MNFARAVALLAFLSSLPTVRAVRYGRRRKFHHFGGGTFRWRSCGARNEPVVNVTHLSVTPDPITIPSLFTLNLTAESSRRLPPTAQVKLIFKRRAPGSRRHSAMPCYFLGLEHAENRPTQCILNDVDLCRWASQPAGCHKQKRFDVSFREALFSLPDHILKLVLGDYKMHVRLFDARKMFGRKRLLSCTIVQFRIADKSHPKVKRTGRRPRSESDP